MTVCGLFFYFLLLEIQMRQSCIKLASISIKKKEKKTKTKQAKPRKSQHHNKFSFSDFPHLAEAHEISRKDAMIFHPQCSLLSSKMCGLLPCEVGFSALWILCFPSSAPVAEVFSSCTIVSAL